MIPTFFAVALVASAVKNVIGLYRVKEISIFVGTEIKSMQLTQGLVKANKLNMINLDTFTFY